MANFDYQTDLAPVIAKLADEAAGYRSPITRAFATLDSTAYYDFATHEFIFDPVRSYERPLSSQGVSFLAARLAPIPLSVSAFKNLTAVFAVMERAARDSILSSARPGWDGEALVATWITDLYQVYPSAPTFYKCAAELVAVHALAYGSTNLPLHYLVRLFELVTLAIVDGNLYAAYPLYTRVWLDSLYAAFFGTSSLLTNVLAKHKAELDALRIEIDTTSRNALPYEVAPARSINIGLRLVYRQEWRPLGVQPGEIVKTIPLGPGESHKLSVQIKRRTKVSRSLEAKTEIESLTESAVSAKDSSELVNEAILGEKWNLTKEGNVDIDVPFVKAHGSLNEYDETSATNTSRATATRLSEIMEKTSSRVRRESTVTVATEGESSFEQQNSSEISNTNNEAAVTYEYMTLQRQYEVFTRLAQAVPVVLVAETLEDPDRINEEWIRRHDWILAKGLRDESFRSTLAEITQDVEPEEELVGEDRHGIMYDAAITNFAQFSPNLPQANGGLSIPDIYGTPQRTYAEHSRERRQRRQDSQRRRQRINRFIQHIKDNLLVYHQLLWSQEPGEQRLLRYRKENRRVPIAWRGTLAGASTTPASGIQFAPTGEEASLVDLIDPSGPLGYVTNYAVYALRVSNRFSASAADLTPDGNGLVTLRLNDILAITRQPFVNATGALQDPALQVELTRVRGAAFDWAALRMLSDIEVLNFLSYLPWLATSLLDAQAQVARDADGGTTHHISREDWAYYLYKSAGTRRFLVDTNNLYLNVVASGGAALEPFKRAHRYLDVLRAAEQVESERLKNTRRTALVNSATAFDPDIQKVVVVNGNTAGAAALAAGVDGLVDGRGNANAPIP